MFTFLRKMYPTRELLALNISIGTAMAWFLTHYISGELWSFDFIAPYTAFVTIILHLAPKTTDQEIGVTETYIFFLRLIIVLGIPFCVALYIPALEDTPLPGPGGYYAWILVISVLSFISLMFTFLVLAPLAIFYEKISETTTNN